MSLPDGDECQYQPMDARPGEGYGAPIRPSDVDRHPDLVGFTAPDPPGQSIGPLPPGTEDDPRDT